MWAGGYPGLTVQQRSHSWRLDPGMWVVFKAASPEGQREGV